MQGRIDTGVHKSLPARPFWEQHPDDLAIHLPRHGEAAGEGMHLCLQLLHVLACPTLAVQVLLEFLELSWCRRLGLAVLRHGIQSSPDSKCTGAGGKNQSTPAMQPSTQLHLKGPGL